MELMGILNVTPDSFSDGGRFVAVDAAIAHGHQMVEDGATIIDVGGESTRPGAVPLTADEEWARIADVIRELAGAGYCISVDTYHASTARRAIESGAQIVNDVTGGRGDSQMFRTVADLECDYILQHNRGDAGTRDDLAVYDGDVAEIVANELLQAKGRAEEAGIAVERIILDPGLGFNKVGDHDWEVLAGITGLMDLGHRVLVGASRKRFLAGVALHDTADVALHDTADHARNDTADHARTDTADHARTDTAGPLAHPRDLPTAVISAYLQQCGVWGVRVHNVPATASAIAVAHKIASLRKPSCAPAPSH